MHHRLQSLQIILLPLLWHLYFLNGLWALPPVPHLVAEDLDSAVDRMIDRLTSPESASDKPVPVAFADMDELPDFRNVNIAAANEPAGSRQQQAIISLESRLCGILGSPPPPASDPVPTKLSLAQLKTFLNRFPATFGSAGSNPLATIAQALAQAGCHDLMSRLLVANQFNRLQFIAYKASDWSLSSYQQLLADLKLLSEIEKQSQLQILPRIVAIVDQWGASAHEFTLYSWLLQTTDKRESVAAARLLIGLLGIDTPERLLLYAFEVSKLDPAAALPLLHFMSTSQLAMAQAEITSVGGQLFEAAFKNGDQFLTEVMASNAGVGKRRLFRCVEAIRDQQSLDGI